MGDIIRVQKNGSTSTGTLNATPPAWGSTTKAGNLLLVVGHEVNGTAGTWPTTPAGYTGAGTTPFNYATTLSPAYGIFWKIAAGGDATPGNYGETSSTQDWVTYTYEFFYPGGWLASPVDSTNQTAQSNTSATTKAGGLLTQMKLAPSTQLVVAILGGNAATSAQSFDNGFFIDQPTTNSGKLVFTWLESVGSGAGPSGLYPVTASWTTSTPNGIKQATFMTGSGLAPIRTFSAAAGGFPSQALASC